ncbi:MAG: putative ABC transporter permease [Lachnospiraceae bacterium]
MQNWALWSMEIAGVDVYHIINWFFIYSFIGWLWETFFVYVKSKKLVNRGFVTGPVCTIYGVGAVVLYLVLKPLMGNPLLIFLGGVVLATVLEYVTSVLMEKLFHTSWWDYSEDRFNFQGRICLGASMGWGVAAVILLWILQPFVDSVVVLYSQSAGKVAMLIFTIGYVIDFTTSSIVAFGLADKVRAMEVDLSQIRTRFNRTRLANALEEAGSTFDQLKESVSQTVIAKQLDEAWKELIEKQTLLSKRILNAYPNLNRGYKKRQEEKKKRKRSRK